MIIIITCQPLGHGKFYLLLAPLYRDTLINGFNLRLSMSLRAVTKCLNIRINEGL